MGFQWLEWQHLIQDYDFTRAMVVLALPGFSPFVVARTMDTSEGWAERLHEWVKILLTAGRIELPNNKLPIQSRGIWPTDEMAANYPKAFRGRQREGALLIGLPPEKSILDKILVAGYGPSRRLKHLPEVSLSVGLKDFRENALSFEATVQNEAVQSWLLGLFSKKAIAKDRGESMSKYSISLERFEGALRLMCEQDVRFAVDIEPALQPRLLMYNKKLDFSQLPDGVRSTVGWLADFLMRMDLDTWQSPEVRANVLLLDEVDAHLHPRWQRSILPSIKKALPEVQVFATSHSPFVIASCPGARIHVLELDDDGHAHNRPAEDAPIGESILATMKDIFGVDSRFDVDTEKLLEEWNQLRRSQAAGKLSANDKDRIAELSRELGSRSEELRQIVSQVIHLSDSLLASLQPQSEPAGRGPAKTRARK